MNCDGCPLLYEGDEAACDSCTVWEDNHTAPIGRRRAFRRSMRKRTFLRLFDIYRSTLCFAVQSDKKFDEIFAPEDVKYFSRYHSNRISVDLKRQGNRKVRRTRHLTNGNGYRKCFDLQWTLN